MKRIPSCFLFTSIVSLGALFALTVHPARLYAEAGVPLLCESAEVQACAGKTYGEACDYDGGAGACIDVGCYEADGGLDTPHQDDAGVLVPNGCFGPPPSDAGLPEATVDSGPEAGPGSECGCFEASVGVGSDDASVGDSGAGGAGVRTPLPGGGDDTSSGGCSASGVADAPLAWTGGALLLGLAAAFTRRRSRSAPFRRGPGA